MTQIHYVPLFRRARAKQTPYGKRRALALSRQTLVVPRISGRNVSVQFTQMSIGGDKVLASASSRVLLKVGWKGSRKSLPASYLTGLMAGIRAKEKGVKTAVFYIGFQRFVRGSRLMAVAKGVIDAGIEVAADPEALPPEERITGEHISAYAKSLLESGREVYLSRFSGLAKNGFKPEEYPKHFETVRRKILQVKVEKNE